MRPPRSTRLRVGVATVLLTAGVGTVSGSAFATTPSPGCCDVLHGVDATSTSDAWAVGEYKVGVVLKTLALHWDGRSWKQVATPNAGGDNALARVVALSRTNAWAVGGHGSRGMTKTLVMHWDGRTWKVVASPNVGTLPNYLYDVDGVSANDIWAVGRYDSGSSAASVERTLVLHWDGRTWKGVRSPNVGRYGNDLSGVAAVSAHDVWAVGQRFDGARSRTLALHWDGRTWKVVSTPNVGTRGNFLFGGADGTSARDAWAAGAYDAGNVFKPLILHWNGRTWSMTPSPSGSTRGGVLYGGVSAVSPTDAWAVGSSGWGKTFVQRWNGRTWTIVASPNVGRRSNDLTDVVAFSATTAWAVGTWSTGTTNRTLIERWDGRSWRVS